MYICDAKDLQRANNVIEYNCDKWQLQVYSVRNKITIFGRNVKETGAILHKMVIY